MKLFKVEFNGIRGTNTYLTVGEDTDTEQTIKERDVNKNTESFGYALIVYVDEVSDVDGHKIIIQK